jgi:hypothetical protein
MWMTRFFVSALADLWGMAPRAAFGRQPQPQLVAALPGAGTADNPLDRLDFLR